MGLPCLSQISFFCDLLLLYMDGEAHFYWRTKHEEGLRACLTLGYTLEDGGWSSTLLSSPAGKGPTGNCQPRADRQLPHPHTWLPRCLRWGPEPAPTAAAWSWTLSPGWAWHLLVGSFLRPVVFLCWLSTWQGWGHNRGES